MDSRKSAIPGMDGWGTPALTGYSCEGFPSRTSRSCLLVRRSLAFFYIGKTVLDK